jgi:hypothetical protein
MSNTSSMTGFGWECVWCDQKFPERREDHVHSGQVWLEIDEKTPTTINGPGDLPDFTDEFLKILEDCANGSYGFNQNFNVDWERFYDNLETYGWDMQDLGGPADEKVRRVVRKMVREGKIE